MKYLKVAKTGFTTLVTRFDYIRTLVLLQTALRANVKFNNLVPLNFAFKLRKQKRNMGRK